MKSVFNLSVYLVVFLLSFAMFLYFSFPYRVLKETLAVKASEATGLVILVGDLSPNFPLGLEATDFSVESPGGRKYTLGRLAVQLNVLPLFMGRLSAVVEIDDQQSGTFEASASIGILSLFTKAASGLVVPRHLSIEAEKFVLDDIANFALAMKAKDPATNVFLKDLLAKVALKGTLNAEIELKIDADDISQSVGETTVTFANAGVEFPPGMQLPVQNFDQAMIKASFKNGTLIIDEASRLTSPDLSILLNGKLKQKPEFDKSVIDLNIDIELRAALKEQLGNLLMAIVNRETDGKLKIKVFGPLAPQPQVEIL